METQITKEILKKVRQVEVRTSRLVNDSLAGSYHSVFKGRGMNFDEVREYVPGDDIRAIDWNVTARTSVPQSKNRSPYLISPLLLRAKYLRQPVTAEQ